VRLVGLDFGTTTSSAVIGSAELLTSSVTGRTEIAHWRECFRAPMVFTPFQDDRLDEQAIEHYLDEWLPSADFFGGGALLTGLAARSANASSIIRQVRQRIGGVLVASADDPCLESWLAFMGNCAQLSHENPQTWFLNLDIGGGTTNIALGRGGEVERTGSLYVGARHVQLDPETRKLRKLSTYARALFDALGIGGKIGDELTVDDTESVIEFYLRLLEAAVNGNADRFAEPTAKLHEQVAFQPPWLQAAPRDVFVTLSGGVGALVYEALAGNRLPAAGQFGDLGVELAKRLLTSPWIEHFRKFRPAGGGRATVFGLMRHNTQLAGSTVFLSRPSVLPLTDIPILGTIRDETTDEDLRALLSLVRRTSGGAAIRLCLRDQGLEAVRAWGRRLADELTGQQVPLAKPLVLLIAGNLGKVLGQYITRWGASPVALAVLDELDVRDAQYVNIGALQDNVIPVSLHCLHP
jgi:ethanolamine utilization protein EutA